MDEKTKAPKKNTRKYQIPANPAKMAWLDTKKKHDKWVREWRPHRDVAASWF